MSSVPKSIQPSTGLIQAAVTDVEEVVDEVMGFEPRPGGMIDRHRQERARRQHADAEQANIAQHIEAPGFKNVKTSQVSPDMGFGISYTILPGSKQMILPASPYRFRAKVLLTTAAGTCVLGKDENQVLGGTGFLLPASVMFDTFSRGQLWAYNNTGSNISISTFSEVYAPES